MIDTTAVINTPCDETFLQLAIEIRRAMLSRIPGDDKEALNAIKSLPKDTQEQLFKYVADIVKTVPYEQYPWL